MLRAGVNVVEAHPRPFEIQIGSCALVIIDLQMDFMQAGGWAQAVGLDTAQLAPVVPVIAALLAQFRRLGLPVIYTREGYRPDLADCPAAKRGRYAPRVGDLGPSGRYMITGEPCNDIIAALTPREGEIVVDKPGAGAFYATLLDHILRVRGLNQLFITGVTADVCVNTTIREANDRGYECVLIEDATASYDAGFTRAVIDMLRIGVAGYTAPSTAVLAALETLDC
jgi:nicotinamidase-related amidase